MVNEKWLIYANALWADIMMLPHNGDMISSEEVEQAIKDAPTVDAVYVVHGQWLYDKDEGTYVCSNCKQKAPQFADEEFNDIVEVWLSHCCPNCGADLYLDSPCNINLTMCANYGERKNDG